MDLKDKKIMSSPYKNKSFLDSFRHAFQGVATAFKEERNMRFHIFSAIVVIICSYFLSLSINEWLWIILIIFLVIIMEIINTVIENITNLISPNYNLLAKKIKDMAAAVVLITSFMALLIGGIILLPKIINFII